MADAFHPRAAIFDLDGTLADTFDLVISAYSTACEDYLGRKLTREEVISRFGPTEIGMLRKELPAASHDRAIAQFRQSYRDNHRRMVRVFDGIPEMLNALRAKRIPMGIMTGKGRDTADITLAELGWTDLFASVITGDESPKPKPAPDGVLISAHQIGVSPAHCIFVGDAPADIQAGKASGATTVWASWHPVYREQIAKLKPDIIANAPDDIVTLFS